MITQGTLLGILLLSIGVTLYITNSYLKPHWMFAIASILSFMGVITYSIYAYKQQNEMFIELKDALKLGMGISLIGGIISLVWSLLLANVLEPDYVDQVIEIERQKLIDLGKTKEEVESYVAIMKKVAIV